MTPFLRPDEDLQVKPVASNAVRLGDLLVYHPRPRESSIQPPDRTRLVTHRVVRCLQVGDQRVLVTKGDNRLLFDPVVLPDQIVGRVVRAGEKDLTQRGWRGWGMGIAWISCLQAILYHHLRCRRFGRLNKLRMSWVRKGWFPAVPLRRPYEAVVSFLFYQSPRVFGRTVAWRMGWAAVQGIRLESWKPDDLELLTETWNRSFPRYPVTSERLQRLLFNPRWLKPSEGWILRRGERCLAWGVARSPGRIEVLAVTEEGWRTGSMGVLFHRLTRSVRRASVFPIILGPMPISDSKGVVLEGTAALAAGFGFQPVSMLTEMALARKDFCSEGSNPAGITIRPARSEDAEFLRTNLFKEGYDPDRIRRYLEAGGRLDRILLAWAGECLVGICQAIPDRELTHVFQMDWIWSVVSAETPRGYFFHLAVDPLWRNRGIGSALHRAALKVLFGAGCSEVRLWTRQEKFFERFGFMPCGRFMKMRLD